ncbi:gfo/Idh/MocA family oxidoreductase [Altererythrobacter salegens]|uniref:Gfo/Idh/MocA family oxidoreductase n=1 Tax=Croceibacterium salegens TaxID=1737568 RepID=A0A6I4T078_9SPHN|nr:gfo/Idh/MocA family oxidoreductase [Croceibacterium salegens]
MNEIALGIVGFGKIAHDQHVAAIAATEGLALAAVADPVAQAEGLPCYPDLAAMLAAQPNIAAVALCMPPRYRAAAAREAIAAGRHILLEKPPCANLAEAEELVQLAWQAGITLFTAWHSQEAAGVAAARDWLRGKAISSITVTWKEDVCVWHPGQEWIWREGGFGVFDPAINALSILTAILPGPLAVTEAELSVPANCATPIAAILRLEGRAGLPIAAEFDFRQTGPQSWDIAIETDQGSILLSHGGNRLALDGKPVELPPEAEYRALYARFAELIHAGESEIDLTPLQLVEQALTLGQVVPVEQFEETA